MAELLLKRVEASAAVQEVDRISVAKEMEPLTRPYLDLIGGDKITLEWSGNGAQNLGLRFPDLQMPSAISTKTPCSRVSPKMRSAKTNPARR